MVGIVRICEDMFDIRHKKRGTRCYTFHLLGLSHLPFTVKRATLNPTPYVNTPIADCEKRSLTTWCIYTHRVDIHRCLFPTVIEICEISVSRTQTLVNVYNYVTPLRVCHHLWHTCRLGICKNNYFLPYFPMKSMRKTRLHLFLVFS